MRLTANWTAEGKSSQLIAIEIIQNKTHRERRLGKNDQSIGELDVPPALGTSRKNVKCEEIWQEFSKLDGNYKSTNPKSPVNF